LLSHCEGSEEAAEEHEYYGMSQKLHRPPSYQTVSRSESIIEPAAM
jgi:hypothetical protein